MPALPSEVPNAASTVVVSFPILQLLTLLFVALKLTHTIDWSWLWVLAPLWMGIAVPLALVILVLLFFGIGFLCQLIAEKLS